MSSFLPVSDLDNPHTKRKAQVFSRRKLSVLFGVLITLALVFYVWGDSYTQYIPKKQYTSKTSGPLTGDPLVCQKSYDGKKPVNQYVVMIDAGSTGSRVHVYQFNNCQKMPQLVNEFFRMKEPGLSSYAGEPQQAALSLDSLLQYALENVPEDARKCTPIAVFATAGLRLLGESVSKNILDAVRTHLENDYPFPVVEETGVSILGGDDEGVYAWVTANYLLGNIGTAAKTPTVAVFDMGGKSTQIVYEPTFKNSQDVLSEGDHKYTMSFGGRDFTLYQHSYLDFGLYAAVDKINREVVKNQKGPRDAYTHPCLPPNTTHVAKTKVPDGSTTKEGENLVEKEVTFRGPDVASPLQCRALAESILEKNKVCVNPPCSFSGVHQPNFFESFPISSDMYVFSYFHDRTAPLGMPSTFNLVEHGELTSLVCQGESAYPAFEAVDGATEALKKNPQWCTELSYMNALLRTGYEIKSYRDVKIAKKINNRELGWCLGASLPLLDGLNWRCRA